MPVADLATLPRRRLDADFHCVSGWTAVGLHWEGVAFADFYRLRIEPALFLPQSSPMSRSAASTGSAR